MRFSVALPTAYEGLGYPIGLATDPEIFARLARTAERLGFDGVWANDHLITPRFLTAERPNHYEALTVLAHVAAVTERVRLGTAVLALPIREPVLLARQASTLDRLSNGRLVLGLGVGAYREELEVARPERAKFRRGLLFDDALATLRASLDRPLLLYIGGHGPHAVARAARSGDGWIPGWQPFDVLRDRIATLRGELAQRARPRDAVAIAPELSATIAARHEDAVARYESSRFVRHRRERERSGRDQSLMTASNLVGSADAIREKIGALEELGVDECAAIAFPAESEAELVEQWTAFAEAIIARATT